MQYKIPVQIENEDPIVLGLSLRQLLILLVGWGIAYSIFKSLAKSIDPQIAWFFAIIIAVITILIALVKYQEMTFIPLILSVLRFNLNEKNRRWCKWVDSFARIDLWYITSIQDKKKEKIDFKNKIDKINELNDKINKI